MEQITQVTYDPQAKSPGLKLRFPLYSLFLMALTGGFLFMILGMRLLPQTAAPDPFASVVSILAAQSKSALQAHGFSCASDTHSYDSPSYADSTEGRCTFRPPTGVFSAIEVEFLKNDLYSRSFLVRQDTLVVGDLVRLWGSPHIRRQGVWGRLDWPGSGVIAWTGIHHGRYSLFLPVRSIVFMYDAG